jgi:ketosteroid isomerase-like protein
LPVSHRRSAIYTFVPRSGGGELKGDGKYETIFKRQADGTWKIFRDCFNSNLP